MRLQTTKEIAKRLGVTVGTVYRMARTGVIPAVRIGTGRGLRFDFEDVKSALSERLARLPSPRRRVSKDPLMTLHKFAVETGIKDLAGHHDHYIYGVPIKPAARPSKR